MLRLRLLIILAILSCASLARAEPQVVVSIKPIHALTASIMAGVGEPSLILKGAASPHGCALSPSDARALQNADLLIWVRPRVGRLSGFQPGQSGGECNAGHADGGGRPHAVALARYP